MKTAVLTDSNSGITPDEAQDTGIFILPMPVIIENETYYEGINLTEEQFYTALTSDKKVTTSQPSPGDVLEQWDALLDAGYNQIIYIPMSSGLSNSCHSTLYFAEEYENVYVVDNHRISVTLRESVFMAKNLADQGRNGAEIKEILEKDAYNSTIYISVNTLTYLKRGGRITPAAAMLGTALNIKPVLIIQGGKLDSFSRARSMKKCEQKMIEAIQNELCHRFPDCNKANLRIGAAGANLTEEQKKEWVTLLENAFPEARVYYNSLSASIGCHTGPGAVGVGVTIL